MIPKVTQVCIGQPSLVEYRGKSVTTGIFKSPVDGSVAVDLLNIHGDGQADLTVHGGRNKAIYVYPESHYAYWAKELDVASLDAAQFGENLTVSGLVERDVIIGSRYRVGTTVVTVTQPRLPCFKLGIRMNDADFPNRLLASGRLGFYLRVSETGVLQAGDRFELIEQASHGFSVHRLWEIVFQSAGDSADIEQAVDCLPHLDDGWLRRLRRVRNKTSST